MKKAKRFAMALTLSAAFAGAVAELDGYRIFDRADGGNFLCERDKSCRPLTPGEIELAKTVFGDTINYRTVKIFTRPYMMLPAGDNAVTPNGNIFLADDFYHSSDFSKEAPFKQALFIHEMAHVHQDHNGTDVRIASSTAGIESAATSK